MVDVGIFLYIYRPCMDHVGWVLHTFLENQEIQDISPLAMSTDVDCMLSREKKTGVEYLAS